HCTILSSPSVQTTDVKPSGKPTFSTFSAASFNELLNSEAVSSAEGASGLPKLAAIICVSIMLAISSSSAILLNKSLKNVWICSSDKVIVSLSAFTVFSPIVTSSVSDSKASSGKLSLMNEEYSSVIYSRCSSLIALLSKNIE